MKKIYLFVFLAAFTIGCSNDDNNNAEPVAEVPGEQVPECDKHLYEPVILTTQAEVDAFAVSGYCLISHELHIGSATANSNITSLAGLASLTTVQGDIIIMNNPGLTTLNGLQNITKTRKIVIRSNSSLLNLNGLKPITQTDFYGYQIIDNASLTTIGGLAGTLSLENFDIRECPLLASLNGLESCILINDLKIISCPRLQNLQGLAALEEITTLTIDGTGVTSLSGMHTPKVKEAIIQNNPALTSVTGLSGTADKITIAGNPGLTSLQGLPSIKKNLDVSNNSGLTSLQGLEHITQLEVLKIFGNNAITTLNGINNLTTIAGVNGQEVSISLNISENQSLTSLQALQSLTTVISVWDSYRGLYNGRIDISGNSALTTLDGLQNINNFEAGISVHENTSLRNLCSIRGFLTNVSSRDTYFNNNFNPASLIDIQNGNCSID